MENIFFEKSFSIQIMDYIDDVEYLSIYPGEM